MDFVENLKTEKTTQTEENLKTEKTTKTEEKPKVESNDGLIIYKYKNTEWDNK